MIGHRQNKSHQHDHSDEHGHDSHEHLQAPAAIWRALIVTLAFMLIEAIGGYFSNSLALLSDAAHMLTDVGALLLSLFALWVSRRPSTSKMTFGYHRAEILGALASGLAIWLIAGVLIYESIQRLHSPPEVNGMIVLVVASIGLIANLASMKMLHHAKHENINVRAAYLHMVSDALGSIGAIVAGLILWLTHWKPIDPIVTILFSGLMLVGSWNLVKEAVEVLMESTPAGIDSDAVLKDLQTIQTVKEAHDLHIWSVSSGRLAMSVHLIVEDDAINGEDPVLKHAITLLEDKYGILHTTIQIENSRTFSSARCYDCASH
jgi:cobalt-zinc-cadmium efflux system protein